MWKSFRRGARLCYYRDLTTIFVRIIVDVFNVTTTKKKKNVRMKTPRRTIDCGRCSNKLKSIVLHPIVEYIPCPDGDYRRKTENIKIIVIIIWTRSARLKMRGSSLSRRIKQLSD